MVRHQRIGCGKPLVKHLRLKGVNYDKPRPSSVIPRTPIGVLEIFPRGSLYFCLFRHCMKSGGLRSIRIYFLALVWISTLKLRGRFVTLLMYSLSVPRGV